METVKNFLTLKAELKELAKVITSDKKSIKETQRSGGYAGTLQFKLVGKRSEFRHKHIACCLMRGTEYEQIEPKCAEGNEPNQDLIRRLISEYSQAEENVCACS